MDNTTQIDKTAQSFLKSGLINGAPPARIADACIGYINKQAMHSLPKARKSAEIFLRRAEPFKGVLLLSAYRILARVAHIEGSYRAAENAYLKARGMAGDNPASRASIDRALVDVYMYLGNFSASSRRARMAIATYEKLEAESDIAKTRVNYANLLHRQDRHREAEDLYRQAAQFFERQQDELSVARCYYNRANTLVQLFDMDEAEKLYVTSHEIYSRHHMEMEATDARYGLAWLRMLRGEFHVALGDLAECEKTFNRLGQVKGAALCELDRAEVYLGLNLFADARESALVAGRRLKPLGIIYETAKANYFRARAEYALGNIQGAKSALKVAATGFARENNKGFTAASKLLEAQIAEKSSRQRSLLSDARKRFARAQLPLWEAVCDLYTASVSSDFRAPLKRLMRNRAVRHVPHLYASWQTLLGDKAHLEGRRATAGKHWQRAADRLDSVRAQLPPVELRTRFGKRAISPHEKLVSAEIETDPAVAAAWSERYQTAGIWAPVSSVLTNNKERQRAEESLNALASQVASLSRTISKNGERGFSQASLKKTVFRLQQQVRHELTQLEQSRVSPVDSIDELRAHFHRISRVLPIVQFHIFEDNLIAFVHEGGSTRMSRINGGGRRIRQIMRQWRFLLESELLSDRISPVNRNQSEHRFFDSLGEWLWKPLELSSATQKILVIPQGELANIPWQAIRVKNEPLASNLRFILTPSLRHYLRARKLRVQADHVHVFAGQADNLPAVYEELRELLDMAGPTRTRLHQPSRRRDWPADGHAAVWHFAGHAILRSDNPFYSYLALADGPLFAADFRLRNARVGLVTLAACRSGEQVTMSGEEATGLVRSLLEMGAKSVVAGHWPVSDKSTATWMSYFYQAYFEHTPITDAVRYASLRLRESYPSAYHWAAFSVFGAGE